MLYCLGILLFFCGFTNHNLSPLSNPTVVHPPTSTESATVPAVPQSHVNTTDKPSISSGIQPTNQSPHTDHEVSVHTEHTSTNTGHCVSRLPKLSLPYSSGDPLTRQTFWDSFKAAVNSIASLTGVQKFKY